MFTSVFVLISAFMAQYCPPFALYLRIAGAVFLIIGVVLLFRYTMTEYVYVLSDGVLSVRRTIGFKEATVFSLVLTEDIKLCPKHEFSKKGTSGGRSYRQNLTAATVFVIYPKDGALKYAEIEPNYTFFLLLKEAIENSENGGSADGAEA